MRDNEAARELHGALSYASLLAGLAPPTLGAVKRLGSYSNLCGTWWDANRTHLPSPKAKPPIHTPPWRACGSVTGRAITAGESPTCGGCQQILRTRVVAMMNALVSFAMRRGRRSERDFAVINGHRLDVDSL